MINFKISQFSKILLPFVLTQVLGIYAALKFLPELSDVKPAEFGDFSIVDLLVFVGLIIGLIILVKRFKPAVSIFFRIFLALIIFSGAQAILSVWLGDGGSIAAALVLVLIFWFRNNVFWHDLIMILTFAGLGAVIGLSFLPNTIVWLLVALSFYDIIAVYKTRHMVALAEGMIRSRAIFGFVIPTTPLGLGERMVHVAPGSPSTTFDASKVVLDKQFMILGSGDVILPLLLSASLVRSSLPAAVVVAAFSVAGLFLMHLIFTNQKTRRPMAALPPIALMTIVGYLVANLF